jgi:hypothetical protein
MKKIIDLLFYLPAPKSAIATISTLFNGYLIPKYSA